jgi:hypothetical protein
MPYGLLNILLSIGRTVLAYDNLLEFSCESARQKLLDLQMANIVNPWS